MSHKRLKYISILALCLCLLVICLPGAFAAAVRITGQPVNVQVPSGARAETAVTAEGDGLTYQWYYANKGRTAFSKASVTTATYAVTMNSTRDGRRIYCVVTDKYGNKATSDTVTLRMGTPVRITGQPADVLAAAGARAQTAVTAEGDGLTYQWYYANKGRTAFSKASVTTATYAVTMNSTRDGRRIYCVVTDKYGNKATSDTVTLCMGTPVRITGQPADVLAAAGARAQTAVTAEGDGLTYQWYYANKGKTKFSKASVTTATYAVTMNSTRDGRRIYCVVTDKYGNKATSATVTLRMDRGLHITRQPVSVRVICGDRAKASVIATGEGLTYQWYYANKGKTKFSKASVTAKTYSVIMNRARDGRRIYCVVTDKYGNQVTSDTVTLGMTDNLRITRQPADVKALWNTTAQVSVAAEGDGLTYQWYYADKDANAFSRSSVTASTYAVTMNKGRNGRRVYCVITDRYGDTVMSSVATLRMGQEVRITRQPADVLAFNGRQTTVSVAAEGDGLTYQWFCADKGESSFTATSATESAYSVEMSSACDGRRVYCRVTDQYGKTVSSQVATLSLSVLDFDILNGEAIITGCMEGISVIDVPATIMGCPVTAIDGWAFSNCAALTSVTLPEGITAIGNSAFSGCSSLIRINLPGSLVQLGSWAFNGCTALQSVTVPGGVTTISDLLFNGCTGLVSVTLPGGITTIGDSAFSGCSSLRGIALPAGLTVIGDHAFSHCSSLGSITVPGSVVTIGSGAFSVCDALTTITLPGSIVSIGTFNLFMCDALTTIRVQEGSYAHEWCVQEDLEPLVQFY